METKVKFGQFVRKERKKAHLTMEQMAELCDMSVRGYADIEIGKSNPKLSTIVNIADALHLDINQFIETVNSQKNNSEFAFLVPNIYRFNPLHRTTFMSHGVLHNKNALSPAAFRKA